MELETEQPSSAPLRTSEQTEKLPPGQKIEELLDELGQIEVPSTAAASEVQQGQIEELEMWKAKCQVFEKMEANLLQKLEKVEQHSVSLLQLLDLACKLRNKAAQSDDDSDRSTWELIKELQQQVEDTSWLQLKLKDIACEKQTLGREAEARGYLVRAADLVELYDDDVVDDDDDDDDDEELDDAFLDSNQIREETDKLWHMTQELNFKHAEELHELDKRNAEFKWELEQSQLRSHRLLQHRDAFSKLREKASSSS